MITVIGEALVDEFPNGHRIGGAPLNFAVHAHHLGEPVRLITRVGRDNHGEAILKALQRRGLDVSGVRIDDRRPTGTVRVTLSADGTPDYDILADVAYDAIDPPSGDADSHLVYFGTLAQRSADGSRRIQGFLDRCSPTSVRFLDINLRPGNYNEKSVEESLERADVLKLSENEIETLKQMLLPDTAQYDLPRHLMSRYAIARVLLTSGRHGATMFAAGGRVYSVSAAPVPKMLDSVGAGDAFAAVWAVGWLRNAPPDRILAAAAAFAAHICGLAGALPSDLRCYRDVSDALGGSNHE